jgi:hypothetical protein
MALYHSCTTTTKKLAQKVFRAENPKSIIMWPFCQEVFTPCTSRRVYCSRSITIQTKLKTLFGNFVNVKIHFILIASGLSPITNIGLFYGWPLGPMQCWHVI